MKTLFDIGQETTISDRHTLLLEIGRSHCYTAFLNRETKAIERIQLSSFDEFKLTDELATILETGGGPRAENVVVCSAFPQALLFPTKYFNDDYSSLDLVYDQLQQRYYHDEIGEWQLVNAYAIPSEVAEMIDSRFPSATFLHAYTPAIKVYNGFAVEHQLMVQLYEQHFRVVLKSNAFIQLAQTYAYKTPLDVAYYLLKICYAFGLAQEDLYLILSGLVEQESNLYAELQQYFTHIHFSQRPELTLPETDLPHYFFTSIYNLAACVS